MAALTTTTVSEKQALKILSCGDKFLTFAVGNRRSGAEILNFREMVGYVLIPSLPKSAIQPNGWLKWILSFSSVLRNR